MGDKMSTIKTKIKAPVNSLVSAKAQITAGADEIYLSYSSDDLTNLSFSGRGKRSYNGINTQMEFSEFKDIIELAHKNDIKVYLAANVPMCGTDIDGKEVFRKEYYKYVKKAIDVGIDCVIVGDLGNIIYLKEVGIDIPIEASVFLGTLNRYGVKFLEKVGVSRICLPHHISENELKSIKSSTNVEIEVFCHFGCSFIESTCSLYHHASEELNIGIPCRAIYECKGKEVNILDAGEDCSICNISKFVNIGVDSIKIIGRELDYKVTSSITKIYRYILDNMDNDNFLLSDFIENSYMGRFIRENFCSQNRCKYKDNDFYIY